MTNFSNIVLKRFVIQILLTLIPVFVFAQTKLVIRPKDHQVEFKGMHLHVSQPLNRPKVGLVLSGGGSRGLAQIGALKVLEKYHIPIDLIVGNSFGSVIGGLYAAGYTMAELESIATHTNWSEILSFSEETKRTDLFVGQKQWQQEGYLLIRLDGLQPIIPSSISGGQRLSNYFTYLVLRAPYHPNPSFDDLKIQFRATATDLYSGKRIILDSGSLSEAMRASVTVPLLYAPLERDSMMMVDGGLVSNIPADIAKSLGCDVIIVVNSTSSMRQPDQLNAPWEIADQIMSIMMQESNRLQLQLADVVITPEVGNRLVSDFSDIDTLIGAGERAAEQNILQILDVLQQKGGEHYTVLSEDFGDVEVYFMGDSIPMYIRQEILDHAQDRTLTPLVLEEYVNLLSMTGLYKEVYAEITEAASPTHVTFYTTYQLPLQDVIIKGNRGDLVLQQELREVSESVKGRVLSYNEIQQTLENIVELYRQRDYSLARIESVKIDPSHQSMLITINEGKIASIRYEGNVRTKDYIIRREFPLDEGNIFNLHDAYQGIVNIRSTGLFEYVLLDIHYERGQPTIILKVNERSSELLRFGFHVDNEHKLVSTINIRDVNFRGAWEDVGITLTRGSRERDVMGEYTVNRIFHSYLTASLRGYYTSHDILTYRDKPTLSEKSWGRIEDGRYRQNKFGWSLSFGSHVRRFGNVTAQLRYEKHQIIGLSGQGYSPEHYRFVGLKFQSIIDTEDKFAFPTEGMLLSLSYESALKSLGSEVGFGKLEASYEAYLTFLPRHTIRPKVTFGFADETLPLAEQFSLGGFNSFFGLRENDSRGRQLFLINVEYRFWFPFKLIFETYLKARYDLGTISAVPQELKLNTFRHGIGAEIALDTPLGSASFGVGKSFYFRRDLPNLPISVGPLLIYFSVGPIL
ncbi:MAG: BamA/TamA family outer membrane protein [Ignavibacteriae bacterium]|nr:BamA/TamA family outer membrane protein [Ignavibacteriota bacterium]